MAERMEFLMSDQSLERLLDACKPVPYIVAGGISPRSQQENANDAWAALGREMGFDYMTAQSVPGKSGHYFTAVPVTQESASPASPAPEQAQAVKDDREHAAWLADKIVALGDYAKEAAEMLRRWPVVQAQAATAVAITDEQIQEAAFAVLRRWKDDRAWDRYTREVGPYDVTVLRAEVLEIIRAVLAVASPAPQAPAAVEGAQPCKRCHGEGCTNEGDPEIGNAYFECDACGGTGKAPSAVEPHTALTGEQEREAFFAWVADRGCDTDGAWSAWQARAALGIASPSQGEDRRDAERYRWLRDEANTDSDICPFYAGEGLDAAIDAALSASKEPRDGR